MITQTTSELASGSIAVAAQLYNAFETPITFIIAIIGSAIIISLIVKAFVKQ